MRYPVILAGSLLAGMVSALPAVAQTAPPLAYVQPVSPQVVQDVQNRLRQAGAYNGQAVWNEGTASTGDGSAVRIWSTGGGFSKYETAPTCADVHTVEPWPGPEPGDRGSAPSVCGARPRDDRIAHLILRAWLRRFRFTVDAT